MKYILLFFTALLFVGCTGNKLNIAGTGLSGTTVVFKNYEQTLEGVNIKDGKFQLINYLESPGYYTLVVSPNGVSPTEYEVYLEPGNYNINLNSGAGYPIINSESVIQTQLSNYHALADSLSTEASRQLVAYKAEYNASHNWTDSTTVLADKIHKLEQVVSGLSTQALALFVTKYPQNTVSAHIMASMDYESDPATYYKIYQKFSDSDKNSADGKEIGEKLSHEIKLSPGAVAPQLAGTTPDGKTIDITATGKKMVLVEFWRARNSQSRKNHQAMLLNLLQGVDKNNLPNDDVAIISVSLEDNREWWLTSAKDDHLPWILVSDLKGMDSPNVDNYRITDLPTYYLLDGKGRIIERNASIGNLQFLMADYRKTH